MRFSTRLHNSRPYFSGQRRFARDSQRRRAAFQPSLAALEGRTLLSTLTVMNTHDSGPGSLRSEIAAAHSGDKIHFAGKLAGQTITLTGGELVISKSLDIEWPSAGKLTVSGNHASRVFDIQGGATVTIAGLTIADGLVVDGLGGGIANQEGATLNLVNDTVADNTAYGIGGGLWNDDGANVVVSGSTFTGNKTFGSLTFAHPDEGYPAGSGGTEGGAIDNDGTAVVSHSTFTGNQVQAITGGDGTGGNAKGGAIATDGPLTVSGCTFTSNVAHAGGGGAAAPGHDGGSGGQGAGGALNIDRASTVADVSTSKFTNNQALGGTGGTGSDGHNGGTGGVGAGGALSMADAHLTLSRSRFFDNQAVGGIGGTGGEHGDGGTGGIGRGGAFVHTVTFGTSTPLSNLDGVTMQDNQALGGAGGTGGRNGIGGGGGAGQGGAIRALLGTINVSDSDLDDNQAAGGAGGVAGAGGAHGGNGGNGLGGGLLTSFGVTATLTNTDLLRNLAVGGAGAVGGDGGNGLGGGIFNDGPSSFGTPDVALYGCTVEFNEADGGAAGAGGSHGQGVGGGIYSLGTFSFDRATVIARNDASTSNDDIFP